MITVTLIAILFILFVTFLLGSRTGQTVPDETGPGKRYLELGIDAAFLLMVLMGLLSFGNIVVAVIVTVVLLVVRQFFPINKAYIPASGIVIAAATLLSQEPQTTLLVLCLAMNFLIGTLAKDVKKLSRFGLLQPLIALLVLLIL